MINNPHTSNIQRSSTVIAVLFVLTAIIWSFIPFFAHAATFAYVNTSGNVSSVMADNWQAAIKTAAGISLHSGVLLLTAQSGNSILGNNVSGI